MRRSICIRNSIRAALFCAALFGALYLPALASIGIVQDVQYAFGSSATSQAITLSSSPTVGNVVIVAVQLGSNTDPAVTLTPNPGGDTWTQASCHGTDSYSQVVFWHTVVSGDSTSIATVSWATASGGAVHASERSGVNTSNAVTNCVHSAALGNIAIPTTTISPSYKNSLAEGMIEVAASPDPCTSPCPGSGFTEDGFNYASAATVLGEHQHANTAGSSSYSFTGNMTTGAQTFRELVYVEAPSGTLVPFCTAYMTLVGYGC